MIDLSMMLPDEVAIFLNLLGIPWVNIDEEEVRRAADHVRSFVTDVSSTIDAGTAEIAAMGADYSGRSYEALLATWARLSETHLTAFEAGGHAVAKAMDVAADLIVVAKAAAVAELGALALGTGALLLTGGGAALQPLVQLAARKIVWALKAYVEQYVLCEVIERAITAFEAEIDRIVDAAAQTTFETAGRLLGVHPADELRIDPDEVLRRAQILEHYADDIANHYQRFADNLAGIDIEPSGDYDDIRVLADPAAPRQIPSPAQPLTLPTGPDPADQIEAKRTTPRVADSIPTTASTGGQILPGDVTERPQPPQPLAAATAAPLAAHAAERGLFADTAGPAVGETARSPIAESSTMTPAQGPIDHHLPETYTQTTNFTETRIASTSDPQSRPMEPARHTPDLVVAPNGTHSDADASRNATNTPSVPTKRGTSGTKYPGTHGKSQEAREPGADTDIADADMPRPTLRTTPAPALHKTTPWATTNSSRQFSTPVPELTKSADITDRPITATADGRSERPSPRTDPRAAAQAGRTDSRPTRHGPTPWTSNRQ
ncbi:hypothetical protein [Nocardia brasiliensis]